METYKTYKAKTSFVVRYGRVADVGEILREPGDITSQEAANLVAMGRIEPMSKTFPPSRKTLTTQSGGSGLVGGSMPAKPVVSAPASGGSKGKAD